MNTAGKSTLAGTAGLALAATGVVFGDIGTSPLYALKETLLVSGTSPDAVYGVVSLIFWALMLVVTVKYLFFVMRADNHGEGGILALLALLPEKYRNARRGTRMALLLLILAGTALLLGDGALTPAISVLSATEGLGYVNENLAHLAVPLTVVILAVLFAIQSKGTHQIGRLFGPVMIVWFVVIGGLGLWRVLGDPGILKALLPTYGISYLAAHPALGLALGAVVILAVTGAEALYADMGHFGRKPIQMAWVALVAPSLTLCYLGQASVVLKNPEAAENPFYALSPTPWFTIAMVVLSTAATVIASQALITGVFSLSRQAVQLGLFPRLTIRHTNHEHEGQIYVPLANWLLGITAIALVVSFGSSTALASAYVLAIAGTMGITTIAFYRVSRDVWGWSYARSLPPMIVFLAIDIAFIAATITKITDGGWVPVALGGLALALMLIWRRGQRFLSEYVGETTLTWAQVRTALTKGAIPTVSRTHAEAVVLASHPEFVPQALASMIRLLKSVPETVTILTVTTQPVPRVPDDERLEIVDLGRGVRQVTAKVGFAENPAIPEMIAHLSGHPGERVYYLSDRQFLVTNNGRMGRFSEAVFAFLHRNAARPAAFYGLPDDRVVTLATHIDL